VVRLRPGERTVARDAGEADAGRPLTLDSEPDSWVTPAALTLVNVTSNSGKRMVRTRKLPNLGLVILAIPSVGKEV